MKINQTGNDFFKIGDYAKAKKRFLEEGNFEKLRECNYHLSLVEANNFLREGKPFKARFIFKKLKREKCGEKMIIDAGIIRSNFLIEYKSGLSKKRKAQSFYQSKQYDLCANELNKAQRHIKKAILLFDQTLLSGDEIQIEEEDLKAKIKGITQFLKECKVKHYYEKGKDIYEKLPGLTKEVNSKDLILIRKLFEKAERFDPQNKNIERALKTILKLINERSFIALKEADRLKIELFKRPDSIVFWKNVKLINKNFNIAYNLVPTKKIFEEWKNFKHDLIVLIRKKKMIVSSTLYKERLDAIDEIQLEVKLKPLTEIRIEEKIEFSSLENLNDGNTFSANITIDSDKINFNRWDEKMDNIEKALLERLQIANQNKHK